MVISLSDGIKIRKFGASARKALQKQLDPTSESSTRITGSSDPSMSPVPGASGNSAASSSLDDKNHMGRNSEKSMRIIQMKSQIRGKEQSASIRK